MIPQTPTEHKLTRARAQLLLNQPFFGTLCLRLWLEPGSRPTMATDGRRIIYNPAFVDELKPKELQAVLAHEVMHCALGHHCRRGQRNPRLWNEAADLAINPILLANGFTLPAGALVDSSFHNLSAEEIYARLLQKKSDGFKAAPNQSPQLSGGPGTDGTQQQPPQGSSGPDSGAQNQAVSAEKENTHGPAAQLPPLPGGFGEVLDASDENGNPASPAERSRQQHEWRIAADQAMRSANACGRDPSNVERPLNESCQSKQDWRAILRDFVGATTPSNYRWTPPNRRYVASGLYLPSIERAGVGPIVIAVDTSGSVGDAELAQFAGEISAISEEAQPEAIYVVYCDAEVQSSQQFLPTDPICLEPKGGGGTDFRPVFEWVQDCNIVAACLIYLTDLCCNSFPEVPEYPVLWVTDSRRTAPFGETVRIAVD